MTTIKITKTQVDKIDFTSKDQFLWDAEVKGFGLKVTPGGSKTYIFQYRYPAGSGGSTRRITIGKHGSPWTPDTARGEARTLAFRVAQGEDPRAEKLKQKAMPTVAQFCDTYLLHGLGTKKQSTINTNKGRIERHIKPLLGQMRISDVTPAPTKRANAFSPLPRSSLPETFSLKPRQMVSTRRP